MKKLCIALLVMTHQMHAMDMDGAPRHRVRKERRAEDPIDKCCGPVSVVSLMGCLAAVCMHIHMPSDLSGLSNQVGFNAHAPQNVPIPSGSELMRRTCEELYAREAGDHNLLLGRDPALMDALQHKPALAISAIFFAEEREKARRVCRTMEKEKRD